VASDAAGGVKEQVVKFPLLEGRLLVAPGSVRRAVEKIAQEQKPDEVEQDRVVGYRATGGGIAQFEQGVQGRGVGEFEFRVGEGAAQQHSLFVSPEVGKAAQAVGLGGIESVAAKIEEGGSGAQGSAGEGDGQQAAFSQDLEYEKGLVGIGVGWRREEIGGADRATVERLETGCGVSSCGGQQPRTAIVPGRDSGIVEFEARTGSKGELEWTVGV